MGFKNSRSRKKFFAQLKKAKPTRTELTIRGGLSPLPKAEIELKNVWTHQNRMNRKCTKA